MRGSLAVLGVGAVVWSGCTSETGPGFRRGGATQAPAEAAASDTSTAPASAVEAACASAPAATSLAEGIAKDVRIAGSAVFYQSGTKVLRVLLDGSNKGEIYTSPDLVSSYVDADALLAVETTGNDPNATLRVIKANAPAVAPGKDPVAAAFPEFAVAAPGAGTMAATAFNSAGTRAFASDATSFYVLADTAAGDAIVKVSKADPNTQTTLVAGDNVVLTNPQITNNALWYVREAQRIFKVELGDEATGIAVGQPKEVFGISYANCSLAVNESATCCSMGSGLERRDLKGGNPMTILDLQKSKTQARFGATVSAQGSLYVRSEAPDALVKHVILAITTGTDVADEKLVACGRGAVTDLAVGASRVVWTEETGGVYSAAR